MANTGYISTLPGILKIVEAVLCLAGFISAMIPYDLWTREGGGWVQFVTITALFGVVAILVLTVAVPEKLPAQFPLIVLIFYAVYSVFLFSAGILAAVRAGQVYANSRLYSYVNYPYEATAACAFFVLVAFIVFVVDTVFAFNTFRAGGTMTTSSSTTQSSSTVTKTTVTVS